MEHEAEDPISGYVTPLAIQSPINKPNNTLRKNKELNIEDHYISMDIR